MGTKTAMGSNFKPEVVKEVFSKVNGHSSIIKLAKKMPVAFSGNDIFTFSLDGEAAIVGEGAEARRHRDCGPRFRHPRQGRVPAPCFQ